MGIFTSYLWIKKEIYLFDETKVYNWFIVNTSPIKYKDPPK